MRGSFPLSCALFFFLSISFHCEHYISMVHVLGFLLMPVNCCSHRQSFNVRIVKWNVFCLLCIFLTVDHVEKKIILHWQVKLVRNIKPKSVITYVYQLYSFVIFELYILAWKLWISRPCCDMNRKGLGFWKCVLLNYVLSGFSVCSYNLTSFCQ